MPSPLQTRLPPGHSHREGALSVTHSDSKAWAAVPGSHARPRCCHGGEEALPAFEEGGGHRLPYCGESPRHRRAFRWWQPKSVVQFVAVSFTVAKRWRQPRGPSVDEWVNDMASVHAVEYYSAVKKDGVLTRAPAWLNLENVTSSEGSQTQKTAYSLIPFL